MDKALSYNDIYLIPRYSELMSRDLADTSITFLGKKFKLPVVPANMKDVINSDIAKYLASNGYFYIMHRWFGNNINNADENINEVLNFADEMKQSPHFCSISIGTGKKWRDTIKELYRRQLYSEFITIDVAHAHHKNMEDIINEIKLYLPSTKIIAGNVATEEGCEYLIKLGADAIKVGIGSGKICSTKNKTGFHVPMFTCCLECSDICKKHNIPMIADGGIGEFGDISKSLTGGASLVMCGGLFAECIDSPAEIINGYKQYRGSTSYEMKGQNKHIEGKLISIKHSVKYSQRLEEIRQALSSAISYAGGTDLTAFKNVEYNICG